MTARRKTLPILPRSDMNCAALIDLGAAKVNSAALKDAERSLGVRFCQVKFYGYNAKKNGELNAYIKECGAEVALPLHNRKKTRIDIRQAIDAVAVACLEPVESIFLVAAEVDCLPLLNELRRRSKKIYLGCESGSMYEDKCDGVIVLAKTLPQAEVSTETLELQPEERESAVDEFLPYTGIEPLDDDRMKEVGDRLRRAVEEKKAHKRAVRINDEKEELKRLLDKYF